MARPTWIVGAVVNVLGSILINLGTNLMKLGHNRRADTTPEDKDRKPVRTFREWQLGIALFAGGNILNFVSFGFAAQSLLAALGSIQFVSNVVFARFVLREVITLRVLGATALIVVGCILLVSFGNHQSDLLTTAQLMANYRNPAYIAYLVIVAVAVAAAYALYRVGKVRAVAGGGGGAAAAAGGAGAVTPRLDPDAAAVAAVVLPPEPGAVVAAAAGADGGSDKKGGGASAPSSPAVPPAAAAAAAAAPPAPAHRAPHPAAVVSPRAAAAWARSLPVTYALFSGMVGTQSVLFCKALSSLLRTTLHGTSQLASWFFWVNLCLLIVTALFWVARLNKGLRLFPAVVIVPTMQIAWTLFSILSGLVYYKEYRTFTPLSSSMFALGVAVVFAGVWALTPATGRAEGAGAGGGGPGAGGGGAATTDDGGADTDTAPPHHRRAGHVRAGSDVPFIAGGGEGDEDGGIRLGRGGGRRPRKRPGAATAGAAAAPEAGAGAMELAGTSPPPAILAVTGEEEEEGEGEEEGEEEKEAAAAADAAEAGAVPPPARSWPSPPSPAPSAPPGPAGASPVLGASPPLAAAASHAARRGAVSAGSSPVLKAGAGGAAAPSAGKGLRRTCGALLTDLAGDFSVDAQASLRPLLGLGPPGDMAAVSLFSVPYDGLLGPVQSSGGGGGGGGGGTHADGGSAASPPGGLPTHWRWSAPGDNGGGGGGPSGRRASSVGGSPPPARRRSGGGGGRGGGGAGAADALRPTSSHGTLPLAGVSPPSAPAVGLATSAVTAGATPPLRGGRHHHQGRPPTVPLRASAPLPAGLAPPHGSPPSSRPASPATSVGGVDLAGAGGSRGASPSRSSRF